MALARPATRRRSGERSPSRRAERAERASARRSRTGTFQASGCSASQRWRWIVYGMVARYTSATMPSPRNGTVTSTAAASPTSTSSGATSRDGTRMVLNDNVGSLLTISPATTTAHTPTGTGEDHQPSPKVSVAYSGRPDSSAAAGAGTPTKNSLAYGGWSASSSVLNRASRSAMQTANTSATTQPSRVPCSAQMYMTSAGATPNETRSDSESSSAPIRLLASSMRARRPSSASHRAAIPPAATHSSNRPESAKYTADNPEHSATTVTALGSSRTPAGIRTPRTASTPAPPTPAGSTRPIPTRPPPTRAPSIPARPTRRI